MTHKALPLDLTESLPNLETGGRTNCPDSKIPQSQDDSLLHESQTDTDVTMCICPVCGYSASSPRGQDEHMETAHGECYSNVPSVSITTGEQDGVVHSKQKQSLVAVDSFAASTLRSPEPSQSNLFSSETHTASTPQGCVQPFTLLNLPSIDVVDLPLTGRSRVDSDSKFVASESSSSASTKLVHREMNSRSPVVKALLTNPATETIGGTGVVLPHKVDSRRRYRCNMCPATFPWHGDLTEHLRLSHGMQKMRESSRSGKAGSFCCVHCKYVAKYQSELRRHMRLHWGVKPFVCVFCPYRSAWKGDLKRHMESHHRERFSSEAELTKIMSQFKNNAGTTVNGIPLSTSCIQDAARPSSKLNADSLDHLAFSVNSVFDDDNTNERIDCFEPLAVDCSLEHLRNDDHHKTKSTSTAYCASRALFCRACHHKCTNKLDLRKHLAAHHPELTELAELDNSASPGNDDQPPFLSSSPDSLRSLGVESSAICSSSEIPPKINLTEPMAKCDPNPTLSAFQTLSHAWPAAPDHANLPSFSVKVDSVADSVPIDLSVGNKTADVLPNLKTSTPVSIPESTVQPNRINESERLLSSNISSFTAPVCLTPVDLMPTWLSSRGPLQHPLTGVLSSCPTNEVANAWPAISSGGTFSNSGGNPGPIQSPSPFFLNQWVISGLMQTWHQHQNPATQAPSASLNLASLPNFSKTETDKMDRKIDIYSDSAVHSLEAFAKRESGAKSEWVAPKCADEGNTDHHLRCVEIAPSEKHVSAIHQQPRGKRMSSVYYSGRLSSSIGVKNEQWKRHQCSGCGHRSNWKWDINKHIKVAHPERTNITTVTLDLEEAKRTFADYMNRLKLSRSRCSNEPTGRTGDSNPSWPLNLVPPAPTETIGEGYYRPYKCSICGHRTIKFYVHSMFQKLIRGTDQSSFPENITGKSSPQVNVTSTRVEAQQLQKQQENQGDKPIYNTPTERKNGRSPSTSPFRTRNSLQCRRILHASRKSCMEFNATKKGDPGWKPLRTRRDGNIHTVRTGKIESTSVVDTVEQLSSLLDELLGLLDAVSDKSRYEPIPSLSRKEQIPNGSSSDSAMTNRNVIQHLADVIEETVSKNENISYSNQLNVSTSSNEENQGPNPFKSTVHDVVHHPAVENRLMRLATIFHRLSNTPTAVLKSRGSQISSEHPTIIANIQRTA
ncbi:transcriptional repressor CTCFL [Clonorchis sinensis]|uniref:Transcriptional repressor CTCFL n=1 Tax=Clonorchis sinensis TaxID=79923 RepID=G7YV61_CLOSI|nr:transcriptional repressor CTCFL [Clonorchis sinensis]